MLYCFVQEDLQSVLQDDSLILQSNYAKAINKYCCCSIKYQTVKDAEGAELSSDHEPIFLRSSCPLTLPAQEILMQKGFVLLEKPDDLQQILHWDTLKLCESNSRYDSTK